MEGSFEVSSLSAMWGDDEARSLNRLLSPESKVGTRRLLLRDISASILRILQTLHCADYATIAESLISELGQFSAIEHKNIKRRTYDAINVMVAAQALRREGTLLGLPQQLTHRQHSVKRGRLKHLLQLFTAQKQLLARNLKTPLRSSIAGNALLCFKVQWPYKVRLRNSGSDCELVLTAAQPIKQVEWETALLQLQFSKSDALLPLEVYKLASW